MSFTINSTLTAGRFRSKADTSRAVTFMCRYCRVTKATPKPIKDRGRLNHAGRESTLLPGQRSPLVVSARASVVSSGTFFAFGCVDGNRRPSKNDQLAAG